MNVFTRCHARPNTLGPRLRLSLLDALDEHYEPLENQVVLRLRFIFTRGPETLLDPTPTSEASLAALVRAVLDELPGVVYRAESQVVAIHAAKEYGNVDGVALSW